MTTFWRFWPYTTFVVGVAWGVGYTLLMQRELLLRLRAERDLARAEFDAAILEYERRFDDDKQAAIRRHPVRSVSPAPTPLHRLDLA